MDPTRLLSIYSTLSRLPGGKRIFSKVVGLSAPYTGTIPFRVEELSAGHARVQMRDAHRVRNHLNSVHAIALMNLGEVTTGLAMYATLPRGARGIVTGLSMDYTKKARGVITGECHAEAPLGAGEHELEVHGVLRDERGDQVAKLTAIWRVQIPG